MRKILLSITFLLSATMCLAQLPERDEVGAEMMPQEIQPILEMDFEINAIDRTVFARRSVVLKQGRATNVKSCTKRINNAIRYMSKRGGGTVNISKGLWRVGRIHLMSNVCLNLNDGAILEFSENIKDYLPVVFTRHEGVEIMGAGAFIYANKQRNIALTGNGTICGPAMDVEMRKLKNGNSVVENDIDPKSPVESRICDGQEGRTFYRPKSFSPIDCEGVLVEGVTFERSVLWNINPVYCTDVVIRGVTVNSVGVPSGDGIDISSCRNVLIEYSTLNCGDDCFTLKSGRCEDGLRVNRPTENVLIRYCLAKEGHGGITCGSETAGGIKNVLLHSCVFDGTRTAFRFKTRRNRAGGIWSIRYEKCRLQNIREAITFDLLGSAQYMGVLAQRKPALDITSLTPTVQDIEISDFIVESSDRLISINGIPEIPCRNVTISNAEVNTKQFIRQLRDAEDIHFKNLKVSATTLPEDIDNCKNINYDHCTITYENH